MSSQIVKLEVDWLEFFSPVNLADETTEGIAEKALSFFSIVRDIVESLQTNNEAALIIHEQKLNQLEMQASKVKQENERLIEERAELQKHQTQLEENILKIQAQNRELFQSRNQLELEINELQKELSEKRNRLHSISVSDSFNNLTAQIQSEEYKSIQANLYTLRTEYVELQYKYSESESTRMGLEFDKIRLEQNLNLTRSQLEKISCHFETLQNDFDELNTKYQDSVLALNRAESELKVQKNEYRDQIELLQIKMTQKQNCIESMKAQFEESQSKYLSETTMSMSKIAELENLISSYLVQNKRTEKLLNESEKALLRIREESQEKIQILEQELSSARESLGDSQKKIEDLSAELESAQAQVNSLMNEESKSSLIQDMESTLKGFYPGNASSAMISRMTELQHSIQLTSTQLAAERTKNRQLTIYFGQLESQIEQNALSAQEQRNQYEMVCEKLLECQNELKAMADLVETQNSELENNKTELSTLKRRNKYLNDRLQMCLATQMSSNDDWQSYQKNHESEWIVDGLKITWSNLGELIELNERLVDHLKELEDQNRAHEQVRRELKQSQEKCALLEQSEFLLMKKVQALNSSMEELNHLKELQSTEQSKSDESNLQAQQANSSEKSVIDKEELDSIRTFVEQARRLSDELCKEINEKNEFKSAAQKVHSELLNTQSELQSYVDICSGYEKQIWNLRKDLDDLNKLLEKQIQSIAHLNEEKQEMSRQIHKLNSDLSFQNLRLQMSEQQSTKYIEELGRVRSERISWEKLNIELNVLLKDVRVQMDEQKGHYESQIADLKVQLKEKVSSLNHSKLEFERIEGDFKFRIEKADERIKSLEDQISTKESKIGHLEKQLDADRTQIKKVEDELSSLQQKLISYEEMFTCEVFDTQGISDMTGECDLASLGVPNQSKVKAKDGATSGTKWNKECETMVEGVPGAVFDDGEASGMKKGVCVSAFENREEDKMIKALKQSKVAKALHDVSAFSSPLIGSKREARSNPSTPNSLNFLEITQSLKKANSRVQELENAMSSLKSELFEKESELFFLQEQNALYKSQVEECTATLKLLENETQLHKTRYEQELGEKERALNKSEESLAVLKASYEQLSTELANLQKSNESNQTRLQELTDENSKLISRCESLDKTKKMLDSALNEKQIAYEDILMRMSDSIQHNRELQDRNSAMEDELNRVNSSFSDAKMQLEEVRVVSDEKLKILEADKLELENGLEEARIQLSELVVSVDRLTNELKYWKKTDRSMNFESESQMELTDVVKNLNDCNAWLNRQYEVAMGRVRILEQQIFILENKVSTQSEQLEAIKKVHQSLEEKQSREFEPFISQFPNLQAAIDKFHEIDLLQESNQVLRKQAQDNMSLYEKEKETSSRLREQYKGEKQLVDSISIERDNLKDQLQWMQGELEMWQKRVEELIEKYRNNDPELLNKCKVQMESLVVEGNGLKERIKEADQLNNRLSLELDNEKRVNFDLQEELKKVRYELEELKVTYSQKIKSLRQKNKKLVELARKSMEVVSTEKPVVSASNAIVNGGIGGSGGDDGGNKGVIGDVVMNDGEKVVEPTDSTTVVNNGRMSNNKEAMTENAKVLDSKVEKPGEQNDIVKLPASPGVTDSKKSEKASPGATDSKKNEKASISFVNKFVKKTDGQMASNQVSPTAVVQRELNASQVTSPVAVDSAVVAECAADLKEDLDEECRDTKESVVAMAVATDDNVAANEEGPTTIVDSQQGSSERPKSRSGTSKSQLEEESSKSADLGTNLRMVIQKKLKYTKLLENYLNLLKTKKQKVEMPSSRRSRGDESPHLETVIEDSKRKVESAKKVNFVQPNAIAAVKTTTSFVKPFSQLAKKVVPPKDQNAEKKKSQGRIKEKTLKDMPIAVSMKVPEIEPPMGSEDATPSTFVPAVLNEGNEADTAMEWTFVGDEVQRVSEAVDVASEAVNGGEVSQLTLEVASRNESIEDERSIGDESSQKLMPPSSPVAITPPMDAGSLVIEDFKVTETVSNVSDGLMASEPSPSSSTCVGNEQEDVLKHSGVEMSEVNEKNEPKERPPVDDGDGPKEPTLTQQAKSSKPKKVSKLILPKPSRRTASSDDAKHSASSSATKEALPPRDTVVPTAEKQPSYSTESSAKAQEGDQKDD